MLGRLFILAALLCATPAYATDLVFIADAVNPANGLPYKSYIDRSTIRREGPYQTVKLIAIYGSPFNAGPYKGVKSMVNTFQVDCPRNVKRVTYIGFLDVQSRVIVEQHYPNAKEEPFGTDTVDQKIKPNLCT